MCAEAGSGHDAIDAARRTQPDVVVLDLGLPDLAGREVISGLRAVAPGTQVVVFTGTETTDRAALVREVQAFVLKDQEVTYLVDLLENLGRAAPMAASIRLSRDRRELRSARQFLALHCNAWGCAPVADDAMLVATELVTNAIVHADTDCELRARRAGGVLRLEVLDGGSGTPDPRATTDDDESGRGLLLVSALCAAWGVDAQAGGGKVVWAELLCSA